MKNQFDPKSTLFLIDGSSFLYRAYYGMRPLHTSTGIPVQAVYSFCRMIKKLLDQFKPHYIAVAWDSKGRTERHELYEEYKATRQAPPSDLFDQKQRVIDFCDAIGLMQVAQTGIEADDILFSLAQDWIQKAYGSHVVIVTSDKDMVQTLGSGITLFDWHKDAFVTDATFLEERGFPVAKLPFYYALLGDTSDNIPGVPGIGKVGATELVKRFDSLQHLYANLELIEKTRTQAALQKHKEKAFLSEQLFILKYHDFEFTKQKAGFETARWVQAQPLFEEYEFKSLLKDITRYGDIPRRTLLSETKGYRFVSITTQAAFKELCSYLKQKRIFALDTETNGLDSLNCDLVGVSVCAEVGLAYYIPCGHETMEEQLPRHFVVDQLRHLLHDGTIVKYLHHAKFDQLVLSQYGIEICGIEFDTLLAAHLVSEDWQRIGLKALSKYYLDEAMLSFNDAVTGNGYKHFAQVPIALATEYAASDAHQTFRLVPILHKELEKHDMLTLYRTIEFPLIQVLYEMEKEGIIVDVDVLKVLDIYVTRELKTIEGKIAAAVGTIGDTINLNSPRQLEQLLFRELNLPPKKKTRTGYSTDQEVLEALAKIHPVPGMIITYRELFKLKSTYLDTLPHAVNPKDGKIHTSFRQTAVATGRLSSSEPNLQNIPVGSKSYPTQVRSAFLPMPGHVFISADYSQIELRVLAYLSKDQALLNAFNEGRDIHTQTAAHLFGSALEKVTSEQRQLGKRINFSILYGLTPYGLSKDLGISFGEAKQYIDTYFSQYPGVSAWMESVIQETKECGYVTTHWGRRRYIPGIYEKNRSLYELACRVAINTKAQGTAAELMKQGMIGLSSALQCQYPDSKLILQIHDEVLVSASQEYAGAVGSLCASVLEGVVAWEVPLIVDVRQGLTWQAVTK
ncbi:DNA polymerase I [Candidatus Babeliales bacterium]|nr:DNA polymerase I [Candidatus Babeliales bacterium]